MVIGRHTVLGSRCQCHGVTLSRLASEQTQPLPSRLCHVVGNDVTGRDACCHECIQAALKLRRDA